MNPVRVVVADDHPVFRDGLEAVLVPPDYQVVASVASGLAAVEAATQHRPDVVLMDLHMPELDGIAATRRIVAGGGGIAVLVLSMAEDDETVFAAMRAGAGGYLLKGADRDDIRRAVSSVAKGEAVFGPGVARRVLDLFAGRASAAHPFQELTEREREVLDLVALGLGNHNIATRLHVSPKTVRNHVHNILTKLHAQDRADAVARARAAGLGRTIDPAGNGLTPGPTRDE